MASTKQSPAVLAGTNRAELDTSTVSAAEDTANVLSQQARWNADNPKALWAHNAVRSAIRRGLIERRPCEVCGGEPADAHHDDYDRPLSIRWLCRLHHRQLHAAERAEGGAQ